MVYLHYIIYPINQQVECETSNDNCDDATIMSPADSNDTTIMSSTLSNAPKSFETKEYDLLSEFSCQAWGHPELFLKNGTFPNVGDIKYVDLSKYLPSIRQCIGGTTSANQPPPRHSWTVLAGSIDYTEVYSNVPNCLDLDKSL